MRVSIDCAARYCRSSTLDRRRRNFFLAVAIFVFSEEEADVFKTNLRGLELVSTAERNEHLQESSPAADSATDGRATSRSGKLRENHRHFHWRPSTDENLRSIRIQRGAFGTILPTKLARSTDLISRFYGFLLTSIDLLVPDFSFLSKMKSKFKTYNINMNMTKMKKV